MKIYEIEMNDKINYVDIVTILKTFDNDFIIYNDYIYLSTNCTINKIKKSFDNNIIKMLEINKNNYNNISNNFAQKWCYDNLLKVELISYERNNQEQLNKINGQLDYLIELQKQGKLEEYLKTIYCKSDDKLNNNKDKNIAQDGGENVDSREREQSRTKEKTVETK
jgi:hypothetical protein